MSAPVMKLAKRWREVMARLAEVVDPKGDGVEPRDPMDAADFLESFMPFLPRLIARLLPLGLLWVELGPLTSFMSFTTYSRLPYERRQEMIKRWMNSWFVLNRELIKTLRGLILMSYYERPEVWKMLDYDPEGWIKEASERRLQTYGDEIRGHQGA